MKGIPKAPELSNKNKSNDSEFIDTNEGKTYLRDTTKPVGDACRDDGTLKDADEMEWPNSPTELEAPNDFPECHHDDYEPGFQVNSQRDSTPLEFPESEDEKTIPQKRVKVSL